jgi:hypothetical protein
MHRPEPKPTYVRRDTKSLSLVQMLRGEIENDFPFDDPKRKQPIAIEDGTPLDLRLTLCNFSGEPITVKSEWDIPRHWKREGPDKQTITLQPWEERVVTRRVIPRELDRPEYTVTVRGAAPNRIIAPVLLRAVHTPPKD